MYNTVTEELIRRIPHVEGFTENLLPVTLTTVYAQIISLSAKYKDGEIPFDLEILEDDRRKLNILSNTLELYLLQIHIVIKKINSLCCCNSSKVIV